MVGIDQMPDLAYVAVDPLWIRMRSVDEFLHDEAAARSDQSRTNLQLIEALKEVRIGGGASV